MNTELKYLYETGGEFTFLLMNVLQTSTNDPFLNGIERMISEERFICRSQTPNTANNLLIDELNQFKSKYQNYLRSIEPDRENPSLESIYALFRLLKTIPTVNIQLDAIKTYQEQFVTGNQRVAHGKETEKK